MTRTAPMYHLHPTVLLQGLDLMGFSGLSSCVDNISSLHYFVTFMLLFMGFFVCLEFCFVS